MSLKNNKTISIICCLFAALCITLGIAICERSNNTNLDDINELLTTQIADVTVTVADEQAITTSLIEEPQTTQANQDASNESSESNNIARYIYISLILFGTLLAVFYVLFYRKSKLFIGPEFALIAIAVSIIVITIYNFKSVHDSKAVDIFIFLILLFSRAVIIYSLRELWSWIMLKFSLNQTALHRIVTFISRNNHTLYMLCMVVIHVISLSGFIIILNYIDRGYLRFAFCPVFLVIAIISICCQLKFAHDASHLTNQINRLHSGNSAESKSNLFEQEELNLLDMSRQKDEAIRAAVSDERFKVELISNVSHDLRTPLTAILGYGELMKKESMSPQAKQQLLKLNQKAGYMYDLVENLFELTKVSSGTVEAKKESIDLIRLIEQTLGLFDEKLTASNLQVKRHYFENSIIIITDGARMHQVFANLIGNAVKYSLKNTRIHIEVKEEQSKYVVRITNIASYEMDFEAQDVMQRFARGDNSRSTDGNGIGLAIAQTYTESVGGSFDIKIDGEQFSALVTLPKLK